MKNIQQNAASAHGSNDQIARPRSRHAVSRHSGQPIQSAPAYAQSHPISQESNQTLIEPVRRDEELAVLFQQMRQVTAVDRTALASHLHTTAGVLCTFEAGEIELAVQNPEMYCVLVADEEYSAKRRIRAWQQ